MRDIRDSGLFEVTVRHEQVDAIRDDVVAIKAADDARDRLGERFEQLRLALGIAREKLADEVDVSSHFIATFERGAPDPERRRMPRAVEAKLIDWLLDTAGMLDDEPDTDDADARAERGTDRGAAA